MSSSCDFIGENDQTVKGPNNCSVAEPAFTPTLNPQRKVLVEEFTGHYCGACPQAHNAINTMYLNPDLQERLVVVAHHSSYAGQFTEPWDFDTNINPELQFIYDFRNPISSSIDYTYNTTTYPMGLVNRRTFGGTKLTSHPNWQGHVTNILTEPPVMDIQIKPFYNPMEQQICAYYYVQALVELEGNYNIMMYLTEDSIIQWQKDAYANPVYVENYLHQHVMRTSLNGLFGTPVNSNGHISTGETKVNGYSISIQGTDWVPEHLHIVAIVYNIDTQEIIQAEEAKMIL